MEGPEIQNLENRPSDFALWAKRLAPESRLEAWSLHSRKLTWKPKTGPLKTSVLVKEGYMNFHVSLGEP